MEIVRTPKNQWLDLDSDWKEVLSTGASSRRGDAPDPAGPFTGFFDGASRGNPGDAGAGALLLNGAGEPVWKCAEPLGIKTNNEAEYLALLLLLEETARRGLRRVEIRGDSRLVVNQVTGRWKINEPRLRELAWKAVDLLKKTGSSLVWVPREENASADALSNQALDGENTMPSRGTQRIPHPFGQSRLEKITEHLFIAHGTEDYAVDVLHGACTCPAFQRYRKCKHLDAARENLPS